MPDWKTIAKLSDKDAKTREAQFEAEMLALIAQGEPQKPVANPVQSVAPVGAVSPYAAGIPNNTTAIPRRLLRPRPATAFKSPSLPTARPPTTIIWNPSRDPFASRS